MSGPGVVSGTIVRGHRVASGQANDPRFPHGTLHLQVPVFAQLGLDLSSYYPGTLNVSIAPQQYIVVQPKVTFRQVQWAPGYPPEDFSFFDCCVGREGEKKLLQGLVYYPHPETKPEHFQDLHTLEILAPLIPGVSYGESVMLQLASEQMLITA